MLSALYYPDKGKKFLIFSFIKKCQTVEKEEMVEVAEEVLHAEEAVEALEVEEEVVTGS